MNASVSSAGDALVADCERLLPLPHDLDSIGYHVRVAVTADSRSRAAATAGSRAADRNRRRAAAEAMVS